MDSIQTLEVKYLDARLREAKYAMTYATPGSAGLDLRACVDKPIWVRPGETVMIPAGFSMHLNNPGYAAILAPRSGLGAKHGIVLGNLVGVLDSDYQDEVRIAIWNRSDRSYDINPMDRVAQMLIVPVIQVQLKEVSSFVESERGKGGFGSSGR